MIISIVNHTSGQVSDEEAQTVIRAINRQIQEDFEPYWSLGATLRLEGKMGPKPAKQSAVDLRGDAVIYLWNHADVAGAIGYHDSNNAGIPFGFVFTDLSTALKEPWSVTLSHEALELVGDPQINLLVQGPHPAQPDRTVFHWYEMCDAVQAETYSVDGVVVSNFLLPLYFTEDNEKGSRNDFLGRAHDEATLSSFGVNPGGYVGFFDPELGEHDTFSRKADALAQRRMEIKAEVKSTRRAVRYQRFETAAPNRRRPAA